MYEAKDAMRIRDIVRKAAKGPRTKESYAVQMAGAIDDPEKALRRRNAAEAIGEHHLAEIFYARYKDLVS